MDYLGAIESYTKAIELAPNYAEAYTIIEEMQGNLGNFDGAIDDYTKAIQFNPDLKYHI